MKRLSKYIHQSRELKAVYTSDLTRAIKSAEIIAEPHGLKPIIMPELRERNFGIWEGMSFDEIREKYPEQFEAWVSNPLRFTPIQGESTIEVRDRVISALGKILSRNPLRVTRYEYSDYTKNIVIVSHGGVNRVILCHLMGIPLENIFRIEQDYGALNVIEFYENYPVVKLINFTG